MNPPLMRLPQVMQATGRCRTGIYNDMAQGLFPPGVKIAPRAVAWPSVETEALVRARIAGKTDDQIKALVASLVAARSHAA